MQLLTVHHVTGYRYSEPVRFGEHRMMFRPRESYDLRLRNTRLEISPVQTSLRWLHDVFDNTVAIATFGDTASTLLRFDSLITLEHHEMALPDYALEEYARTYPFRYADDEMLDLVRGLAPRYPSHDVAVWVAPFVGAGVTETVMLLRSITAAIKQGFRYKQRWEKGIQSPSETLQHRRGSCRDFAVFMIEVARHLGLAARFVSGYIFAPNAESPDIEGGGSTHAWMQVYLPGAGWVDFDPTNDIIGNRNLIRVAVAWDAEQVVPLWGTFIGAPDSFLGMDVSVDVRDGAVS